jgi:hypothetical protein
MSVAAELNIENDGRDALPQRSSDGENLSPSTVGGPEISALNAPRLASAMAPEIGLLIVPNPHFFWHREGSRRPILQKIECGYGVRKCLILTPPCLKITQ